MKIFSRDGDYAAFEKAMGQALELTPVRLLSYCLMPNHWHLVLWPRLDGELSRLMFWLTMTHTQRWRHARGLVGLGPLYQGRFKAFPVETDAHYLTVCRYVERNALRANLVARAEEWKWSSLNARVSGREGLTLSPWPVAMPGDWLNWVNEPQTDAEVQQVRSRIRTGRPLGSPEWERRAAERLGIDLTPKPRGRPPKAKK
jgi:putative transposase